MEDSDVLDEATRISSVETESSTVERERTPIPTRSLDTLVPQTDRIPLKVFLSYVHSDEKARNTFRNNLEWMKKKKYVEFFFEHRIDPKETKWKKEIEEHLEKMDVFVGLLTTNYLASNIVHCDELTRFQRRMKNGEGDVLFLLILLENVAVEESDLPGYKIVKPSGKPISKHKNKAEGFNDAQRELERLFQKRLPVKRPNVAEPTQPERSIQSGRLEGMTLHGSVQIFTGSVQGVTQMRDDRSIHIAGSVINSQVGQTLINCTNLINQQPAGERKDLLDGLQKDVRKLIDSLPEEKKQDASEVSGNLELLVKSVTADKPNRSWYSVSAAGLLEASKWVKDFTGNIGGAILNLGKKLWPDFSVEGELGKK